MERRDYILQLIQQLGRMLARVRELIAGGQLEAARAELDTSAANLGIAGGLARVLADDSLLALLTVSGQPDVAKRLVVAELFYVDALRARERGAAGESIHLLRRAKRLLESVAGEREALATLGLGERLDDLNRLLSEAPR